MACSCNYVGIFHDVNIFIGNKMFLVFVFWIFILFIVLIAYVKNKMDILYWKNERFIRFLIIFIALAVKAKRFAFARFPHLLLPHNFSEIMENLEEKIIL